ncbi:MAG: hypothetical protein AB8B85_06870 [Paracoccaceae bacterium]
MLTGGFGLASAAPLGLYTWLMHSFGQGSRYAQFKGSPRGFGPR